ncbi:hypothetical protein L3Q82_012338, partial [Scortum barcoo]
MSRRHKTRTVHADASLPATSEHNVVEKNDVLSTCTSVYFIQDFIGEGSFGKVAKCTNLVTSQEVAVKILKKGTVAQREVKMLQFVSTLDPVKNNIIQFFEVFEHRGLTCLAFELLGRSLFDHLVDRSLKPLPLTEIRQVAQQMLTALDALRGIGIIHSDIKPDNIMLCKNQDGRPGVRVKLIDFGVSFTASKATPGMVIQPLGYRAPEVILGLPITEAIDIWGLGCVLIFLHISNHPFSIDCQYQMMRDIILILGQPAHHLLSAGMYTHIFFNKYQYPDCEDTKWWLKTQREYHIASGKVPIKWDPTFISLYHLIQNKSDPQMWQDEMAFVGLLKSLLHTDPEERTTPVEALRHPFFTAAHLMSELPIATSGNNSAGSAALCSNHGVIETSHTVDGAATYGERDAIGSAEKKSAARKFLGEEMPPSAIDGSPSCSFTNKLHTNDGAATYGDRDAIGSAEMGKSAASKTDFIYEEMPDIFMTLPATVGSPSATVGLPSRYLTDEHHANDGGTPACKKDTPGSSIIELAARKNSSFSAEEIPASKEKPAGYDGSHLPTDQTPVATKEAPSAKSPP